MSIGGREDGSGGGGEGKCFVCGSPGNKKCSRCKSVRYCSLECQTRHWKESHKLKCKESKSLDNSPVGIACGRRKAPGFGSAIALVPSRGTCKALERPKKILFPYDEFVRLFNWDKHNFSPCGLLNCGNSCFANVVLQCLACTRPLIAYLLEGSHGRSCSRNDWCFLCELQVHVHKVSKSLQPFSPMNILSRLPNIGGNLGYGRQEDAHEFMRFAIDTMQSVCLDEFGGEKALDPSTRETTLIQHIFGGQLQSQVICTKCNMVSNRYESMMDLTVEIQGDAESLEDCLDQFTVKEPLDGENMYKCDGCNEYVKAWKRLTVHQPPNILTVALKRFQSGRFGKLNKRVTFPESLNLGPYMSGAGDGTDQYILYAVVVHVDMLNASFFGHYICYTKDFHGNWYRIDDCKVMKVEVDEVLSQGAYMLLYSRINVRQPFIKPAEPTGKKGEQSVQVAPELLSGSESTSSVDNRHERELSIEQLHGEPDDMDLDKPVKINIKQVGQGSGDLDFDEPVEFDGKPINQHPVYVDTGVSDSRFFGAKDLEENTSHFQSDAVCPFEKESGSISSSDEICHESGKASFGFSIPTFSSVLECSSPSVPYMDHIALGGQSDSGNRIISLGDVPSAMENEGSEDLAMENEGSEDLASSNGVNSLDTGGLKLHFSPGFPVNSIDKEERTKMENGVGFPCRNNRKLLNESDASNSRGNLEPLFSVGFLDDRSQRAPKKELTRTEGSEIGLLPKNSVDEEERKAIEHLGFGLCCRDNKNCNGLLSESDRSSSRGNSKPLFSPGFLDSHSEKERKAIEHLGFGLCCRDNKNCNGLLSESDKLSSRGNSKPLFSPGFLDSHSQRRSPEEKIKTENSRVNLPCQHSVDKEEGTQIGNVGLRLSSRANSDCNGLLYEFDKPSPRKKPLFSPGFLDYHSPEKSANGKTKRESILGNNSADKEERTEIENGVDGVPCRANSNCNGLLYESDKPSTLENLKPLFSPGFLDHHKSQKEKRQMENGGVCLPCKDNGNCNRYRDSELVQLNGNRKDLPLDCVMSLSRNFLNNSHRESQEENGNAMKVQKGYGPPSKTNGNLCTESVKAQTIDAHDASQEQSCENGQ